MLVKLDGLDQSRGFRAHKPISMADAERIKTNPRPYRVICEPSQLSP